MIINEEKDDCMNLLNLRMLSIGKNKFQRIATAAIKIIKTAPILNFKE